MGTDPTGIEPDEPASREEWSSPKKNADQPVERHPVHPRADGEDADFEALEMEHRGMSAQR